MHFRPIRTAFSGKRNIQFSASRPRQDSKNCHWRLGRPRDWLAFQRKKKPADRTVCGLEQGYWCRLSARDLEHLGASAALGRIAMRCKGLAAANRFCKTRLGEGRLAGNEIAATWCKPFISRSEAVLARRETFVAWSKALITGRKVLVTGCITSIAWRKAFIAIAATEAFIEAAATIVAALVTLAETAIIGTELTRTADSWTATATPSASRPASRGSTTPSAPRSRTASSTAAARQT